MNNIETTMRTLRLHGMERNWKAMTETRRSHELTLSEGLELLLQAETDDRDERRYERLKQNAGFRYPASIEELNMEASRGIDRGLITNLATGEYLKKGDPVLICGATGCGKSFLASALGHQACAQGYKVAYYNMQKLLLKTKMTRLEGTLHKLLDRLSKTDLLILDDFGLVSLEQQQRLDLMEIIEDRHGRSSTIIASQLPVGSWYDVIGENTVADALLDRLVHRSYRIELKGESLRKKR
ncbi:IS21-like element helper ATPase IstB [Sphingobacterium sp. JB170]|uniref:IS21-like element helper ATPase IstB n=1 Tax=Sphingobacterium sp. JB170 TaxID=1434842 RepID=UPI00097E95A5|nr:IS21-like element helper ATPase IstB [Sphingobacterium sp. JB170]SJN24879.1 Mobile element protein [Sphingobacterium sp. JB170]